MDMLEDYLRAVSRLLPRAKREDIVAELRDEILTRIETKEGELGRKLTPDETEAVLRDFGHPIVVAARYRDEPQVAVGQALYPYWNFAVRCAIVLEVLISGLVFVTRLIGGANFEQAFGNALGSGLTGVLTLIGIATVACWIVERKGITVDYFKTWRVRDLRFLDFAFWDWADASDWLNRVGAVPKPGLGAGRNWAPPHGYYGWTVRQSSAGRGVGAIVMGVLFLMWWTGVIRFGLAPVPVDYAALNVDPGRLANVDYAAFKTALYWPVLFYFTGVIAFGGIVLAFPRSVRLRGVIEIAIGCATVAFCGWVWQSSPIAAVVHVGSADSLIQRIVAFFQHPMPFPMELAVTVFLVFVAFGGLFRALGGLWELLTGAPRYIED